MDPKTDTRNVIDHYKGWETDMIKADLDTKRFNYSVLCANIVGDFAKGTIIRSANAFLAKEIILYGKNHWDRRSAVGTHNYTTLKHVKEFDLEKLKNDFKDSIFIGLDNIDGYCPIETFKWPYDKHVVLCFGEEKVGLPKEIIELCDYIVGITQYGSVRSLNVGCAATVAMYDFLNKMPSDLKVAK